MISLSSFLVVGALLFSAGIACVLIRKNTIHILMGIELILNAAALNFVAFAHFGGVRTFPGQAIAIFVIVLAAAEAAVALALILAVYRLHKTVQADQLTDLRG